MANNNVNPSGYKFNIPPVNSDPFWDNSGGGDVPDITASATVDSEVGTPSVDVVKSGVDPINFAFSFHNLKGEPGTNGTDGQDGADGTTPAISITGTINTTAPASPSVTVTKTGTDEAPNFNFAFGGLNALQGKVFSGNFDPDTSEPIYNDSPIITNNLIQNMDDLSNPSFDGKEGALIPSIRYVNTEFLGKQSPLYGLDDLDRSRALNSYYNDTRNLIQTVTGYSNVHDGLQIPSMRALMEVYTEALNKGSSSGGFQVLTDYAVGGEATLGHIVNLLNQNHNNWRIAYIRKYSGDAELARYTFNSGDSVSLVYGATTSGIDYSVTGIGVYVDDEYIKLFNDNGNVFIENGYFDFIGINAYDVIFTPYNNHAGMVDTFIHKKMIKCAAKWQTDNLTINDVYFDTSYSAMVLQGGTPSVHTFTLKKLVSEGGTNVWQQIYNLSDQNGIFDISGVKASTYSGVIFM